MKRPWRSSGGIVSPSTISPLSAMSFSNLTESTNGHARGGPSRNFRLGFSLTFVNSRVPGWTTSVAGEKSASSWFSASTAQSLSTMAGLLP